MSHIHALLAVSVFRHSSATLPYQGNVFGRWAAGRLFAQPYVRAVLPTSLEPFVDLVHFVFGMLIAFKDYSLSRLRWGQGNDSERGRGKG